MSDIDMFKFYPSPEGYIPCNRPRFHKKEMLTIMTGETTVHSFDVPFNVEDAEEGCITFRAIYKLGVEVVLVKDKEDCDVLYDEDNDISTLTWTLSPAETLLFKESYLNTQVQIEFVMLDHSIAYTDKLKVKVTDSLNKGEV